MFPYTLPEDKRVDNSQAANPVRCSKSILAWVVHLLSIAVSTRNATDTLPLANGPCVVSGVLGSLRVPQERV